MVSRRLDFDQEDSSLQETPALSGSGARRGKSRRDVYDVEQSPTHTHTVVMEESVVQEEATVNEDSPMVNGIMEESFAGIIGEDYTAEAIDLDASVVEEESEVVAEPIKQPAKRGRKRKSDVDESATGEVAAAPQRKKRGTAAAQSYSTDSFEKSVQPPIPKPRGRPARAKRTSEITEEEPSTVLEAPTDDSLHVEESPVAAPAPTKGRGRRPKVQVDASADISEQIQKPAASAATKSRGRRPKNQVAHSDDSPEQTEEAPVPTATKHRGEVAKSQTSKAVTGKENAEELVFKKPKNPTISKAKTDEKLTNSQRLASGKLVNNRGIPLSKEEIDRQSITTTGSRFGRGRTLSVFRELGPEEYGRVGRTGRHHLPPVNFWANERAEYERDGSLKAILKDETKENEPIKKKSSGRQKGKKRAAATIEEDEEELEEWETEDGIIEGDHRDFDPVTETTSDEQLTSSMSTVCSSIHYANYCTALAWADKAIVTREVPSLQFKFVKLDSAGTNSFFSWGCIELEKDGIKRTKNARRMHMVFQVMKGAVDVTVADTSFTIHRNGVFQVPRGKFNLLIILVLLLCFLFPQPITE